MTKFMKNSLPSPNLYEKTPTYLEITSTVPLPAFKKITNIPSPFSSKEKEGRVETMLNFWEGDETSGGHYEKWNLSPFVNHYTFLQYLGKTIHRAHQLRIWVLTRLLHLIHDDALTWDLTFPICPASDHNIQHYSVSSNHRALLKNSMSIIP